MVRSYCRGRDFENLVLHDTEQYSGTLPADLEAVVTSVAARVLRNPQALRSHTLVDDDLTLTDVYTTTTSRCSNGGCWTVTASAHRLGRRPRVGSVSRLDRPHGGR